VPSVPGTVGEVVLGEQKWAASQKKLNRALKTTKSVLDCGSGSQ
jgi:hypothetical protein